MCFFLKMSGVLVKNRFPNFGTYISDPRPRYPAQPEIEVDNTKILQPKAKRQYAKNLIVVRNFRVDSKMLTSKFWFSRGLISNMLV